jgi:hypothetical protein
VALIPALHPNRLKGSVRLDEKGSIFSRLADTERRLSAQEVSERHCETWPTETRTR